METRKDGVRNNFPREINNRDEVWLLWTGIISVFCIVLIPHTYYYFMLFILIATQSTGTFNAAVLLNNITVK